MVANQACVKRDLLCVVGQPEHGCFKPFTYFVLEVSTFQQRFPQVVD